MSAVKPVNTNCIIYSTTISIIFRMESVQFPSIVSKSVATIINFRLLGGEAK